MTKKVYVVTTGEYSDYSICTIFSTMEKAEQYTKYFNKDADYTGYDIEEYELDPVSDTVYRENKRLYAVQMWKDGEIRQAYITNPSYHNPGFEFEPYGNIGIKARPDDSIILCSYCWAKSEEHAIKITNEKRGQLIALNQWPTSADNL